MAFERSVFERISRPDEYNDYKVEVSAERLSESVLRHLQQMMNVRQGSVPTVPDYGLPDFNDIAMRFPDAIVELRRAIKQCIERYEPRLAKVKVDYVPEENDPLTLRFEITAQLRVDEKRTPVWFETTLNSAGKVAVKG